MGIPGTIKLSSTLASEIGTLGGTENHPEKCRVSRSTNTHIRPPPRSHGAGFRPEGLQLWVCTHILCGPCHHSGTFLSFSVRSRGPHLGHAHFLTRRGHAPQTPAPPKARRPEAPETPQRMPGRDRDVKRASLVWVVVLRGRGRAWPRSPGVLLLLSRCRYPLGLHHVPQQQSEAALDLCGRGAAGAPAGRRQPQIQVQSGG